MARKAEAIPEIKTPGSKKFLVFWERMANSGMFIVNAETAGQAIEFVGFSKSCCRMTAVEFVNEPLQVGEAK